MKDRQVSLRDVICHLQPAALVGLDLLLNELPVGPLSCFLCHSHQLDQLRLLQRFQNVVVVVMQKNGTQSWVFINLGFAEQVKLQVAQNFADVGAQQPPAEL